MENLAKMRSPASRRFNAGDTINGKYSVCRHLGRGAMGNVYLADHLVLNRLVALKVLHAEFCTNEDILGRFIDEARVLASLQSPHTVRILDADLSGGGAFLVMEYVEGMNLGTFLEKEEERELATLIEIAGQIATALSEAHARGIVHRDIKPENVLLSHDEDGRLIAKVADFGIAKRLEMSGSVHRTLVGTPLGTPCYMAPEQFFSPESVDQRADLFGLGVIIYEMCSGFLPFGGDGVHEIMEEVRRGRPLPLHEVNAHIPRRLSDLVERCLKADARERIGSVDEIVAELEAILDELGPASGRRLMTYRPRTFSTSDSRAPTVAQSGIVRRRRPSGIWTLGLVAIAAVGGAMVVRGDPELERRAEAWSLQAARTLNLHLSPDGLATRPLAVTARRIEAWTQPAVEGASPSEATPAAEVPAAEVPAAEVPVEDRLVSGDMDARLAVVRPTRANVAEQPIAP